MLLLNCYILLSTFALPSVVSHSSFYVSASFPPVPNITFFISFPINLKGEIYFCRNFPSKAFESPSLDVTPPLYFHFLFLVPLGPLSHHHSLSLLYIENIWPSGTSSWIKQRRDRISDFSFVSSILSSYYLALPSFIELFSKSFSLISSNDNSIKWSIDGHVEPANVFDNAEKIRDCHVFQ